MVLRNALIASSEPWAASQLRAMTGTGGVEFDSADEVIDAAERAQEEQEAAEGHEEGAEGEGDAEQGAEAGAEEEGGAEEETPEAAR